MVTVGLIACIAVLSAFALFQFGARRVYGYALTPSALEVRLFGRIPVYRAPLRSIESAVIWVPSVADVAAGFTTLRVGNRIAGPAVAITRRGWPRRIIVTPDEPRAFLARLHALVEAAHA